MKLLLDANISRRIVPEITEYFGECVHVNTIGLPLPPTDLRIWNYAKQYEYIIVTQDTDFLHFFEAKGFPPKVVFLTPGVPLRSVSSYPLRPRGFSSCGRLRSSQRK